jgi:hypothetical protein
MEKRIRIIKSSSHHYWYKPFIGKEYNVKLCSGECNYEITDGGEYFTNGGGRFMYKYIGVEDCIVVSNLKPIHILKKHEF